MSPSDRLPLGVCAYGIPFLAGFAGRGTPRGNPAPLSSLDLIDLAADLGLRWVELRAAPDECDQLRERAAERGIELLHGAGILTAEELRQGLDIGRRLGARVVRCVLSGMLEGDRGRVGLAGWRELLANAAAVLREAAPRAADAGLRIGVENHQDASSADLAWLCETVDHPSAGVTLDVGNALAVAEHLLDFARRVAPWVVDMHLKDYRMLRSDAGYRLAHCPIGAGVVDFGAVLALFADRPELPRNIEMAALGERHVRVLDPAWWAGHPPREVSDWLPFLGFWRDHERDGDWRTPFETEPADVVADWERACLLESVANMTKLLEGGRA